MRRAFMSYAREDAAEVGSIEKRLRQLDYDVWMDQVLKGGQAWWDEILSQIRQCDVFIAIISPTSLDSQACAREREYAEALGKPVLPVAIVAQLTALPGGLAKRQIVDYSEPGEEAAFRLASALVATPEAPPVPESLPEPPEVPLSYLAALIDQASSPGDLSRSDQLDMLNTLEPGLRAADASEREGAWHVLQLLEDRFDLYADSQRRIARLRESYGNRAPSGAIHGSTADRGSGVVATGDDSHVADDVVTPVGVEPDFHDVHRGDDDRSLHAGPPHGDDAVAPSAGALADEPRSDDSTPAQVAAGSSQESAVSRRGNPFSWTAVSLGALAALVLPIVFGPIAVVAGGLALIRKESRAALGIAVAIAGTVVGLGLGALVAAGS